jgi:hypothetical protein
LEHAAALGTPASRRTLFWYRIEALIRSDRGADAAGVLDEIVGDPGRDTMEFTSSTITALNALLGRHRPAPVDSARARQYRARLDSLRRSRPPAAPPPPGFRALLESGDTVGARHALARMDSAMAAPQGMTVIPGVGAHHLELSEYHLALADTAAAEQLLARIEEGMTDRRLPRFAGLVFGGSRPWLGHAWVLSGELAAARGRLEEAGRMYRRVIGLWGAADPDLQPVVELARARLDSLSER